MRVHFRNSIISLFFLLVAHLGAAQDHAVETTGDVILFALPAATFATTLIVDDSQGSWQYTKGLLMTAAVTYSLKWTINKPRPDGSDQNSFPSGHTSVTFQSASFVHKRYGFINSIPAYALAGFTAVSRLDANKHDGWDLLAGTVIGIGSTYLFTSEYQKDHLALTYSSGNGDYLIGLQFKF